MKYKLLFLIILFYSSINYSQKPGYRSESVSFLSDLKHTGAFNSKPVASAPEVKFSFRTDGAVRSTPLIFKGRIFFGSGDSFFYCLDETGGRVIWKFKTSGAVNSSAAVSKDKIYFSGKDGYLYCLNSIDGKLVWKTSLGKELFYRWEFDYYTSTPQISDGKIYIGSGDGNLYAVNPETGKVLWKYFAGSRIRSTPCIYDGFIYFGDFSGKVYALDLKTQRAKWIYETEGSKIKIEDFGFDRSALVSSATITGNSLLIGSREGCLYCLDLETGKLNWKDDQKMSWVISTPSVYKENVIAGTSDGHFVKSLNIKSGTESWRYKTGKPVWSSIFIAGDIVYGGDYDGNFFALNAVNGNELWKFKTDDRIHSSSVVHNGVVYFGSDDGYLYGLIGSDKISGRRQKAKKAVYWEESKGYNYFANKTDEFIKNFFVAEGYDLLDSQQLKIFIEERLKDNLPSAVIFARNEFPPTIVNDSAKSDLLREYLKGDNKIVLLGENPLAYKKDNSGKLVEIDYRKASRYFGIEFGGELTDAMKGLYSACVTEEGTRIGLKGFWISMAGISPDQVTTVFAMDENGRASSWLKNYGGPENSGLMQLWVNRQLPSSLAIIKNAVEFRLQ